MIFGYSHKSKVAFPKTEVLGKPFLIVYFRVCNDPLKKESAEY
jgi:hypothetical protein